MSQALSNAHLRGWNLATTLMVLVVVFRIGRESFGVMPSAEYDGDPTAIVHDYDPYEIMESSGESDLRLRSPVQDRAAHNHSVWRKVISRSGGRYLVGAVTIG
jgi:hypothetical protein